MKVYLSHTLGYQDFDKVLEFLKSVNGPILFIEAPSVEINHKNRLDFNELFGICQEIRGSNSKINQEDFVVILTEKPNTGNWFSAFQKNNIFVHTADWEQFTTIDSYFAVAFQVCENIIQSKLGFDIDTLNPKYVHKVLRGCLNDFCQHKPEVIAKMKTATLCDTCLELVKEKFKNEIDVFLQIKTLLNKIRYTYDLDFTGFDFTFPSKIKIYQNKSFEFERYNTTIKLDPLKAAIYAFFLKNLNCRFSIENLRDTENIKYIRNPEIITKIDKLYRYFLNEIELPQIDDINFEINENDTRMETIQRLFRIERDGKTRTLESNRSRINKEIREKINIQGISQLYQIHQSDSQYFINLNNAEVEWVTPNRVR